MPQPQPRTPRPIRRRCLGLLAPPLLAGLALQAGTAHAQTGRSAVPLSASEARATQLSGNWRDNPASLSVGADGEVVFLFGQTQPTVVCAPLRLCDIRLEAGETVLDVNAGDSVRWKFTGARSGPDGNTPHLLIKPVEADIETSLVVTTDRRSYHIHLKAVADRYMARTAFDYAADPQALLRALAPDPAPIMPAFTPEPVVEYIATEPGFVSAADLDFDYDVDGKARWRPLRVYNDGVRTYIDMPASVSSASLPAFQVEGGDGDAALVNYRFRDGRFIVDQLFDRGFLTLGVGKRREEVRIRRRDDRS